MRKGTSRLWQVFVAVGLAVWLVPSPLGVDGAQRRKKRKPDVTSCVWIICTGITASTTHTVQGGRVTLTALTTNPAHDPLPLTYTWLATDGMIEGSGSTVVYVASVDTPGDYTVYAQVSDPYNPPSDCSKTIRVASASECP